MNSKDRSTLTTIYRILIGLTISGPIIALYITLPFNLPVVFTIALIANLIISKKYYTDMIRNSFDSEIKKLIDFCIRSITILFFTSIPAFVMSYFEMNEYNVTLHIIAELIDFFGSIAAWGYYLVMVTKSYYQFNKTKKKKTNLFIA